MYISYPDGADPFAINDGRKQAEFFALRFKAADEALDQSCIVSDLMGNIRNPDENVPYFCELVGIPRDSVHFQMLFTTGEREFSWDAHEGNRYWLSQILFGLLDESEFDFILQIAEQFQVRNTATAMQLLEELRRKRLDLVPPGLSSL